MDLGTASIGNRAMGGVYCFFVHLVFCLRAAVQAWDTRWCVHLWGRGWVMCGLVIFSHLPLFSPDPN